MMVEVKTHFSVVHAPTTWQPQQLHWASHNDMKGFAMETIENLQFYLLYMQSDFTFSASVSFYHDLNFKNWAGLLVCKC